MQDWFKFFGGEYLSDPKMLSLTPAERSCWITLLCYASISDIPGEVRHITENKVMLMAGIEPTKDEWQETEGLFEKLEKLEMILRNDNGMITISNYRKRQGTTLTAYERVKKSREMKRNDNAMITHDTQMIQNDNARVEENRIEYISASPVARRKSNMLKEENLTYDEDGTLIENEEVLEKKQRTADFNLFLEVYKKGHKERIGGDPPRYTYQAVRKNYKKALKLYKAPELLELLPIFFETNFYESTNWSPLTFLGEKVLNQLKNEK